MCPLCAISRTTSGFHAYASASHSLRRSPTSHRHSTTIVSRSHADQRELHRQRRVVHADDEPEEQLRGGRVGRARATARHTRGVARCGWRPSPDRRARPRTGCSRACCTRPSHRYRTMSLSGPTGASASGRRKRTANASASISGRRSPLAASHARRRSARYAPPITTASAKKIGEPRGARVQTRRTTALSATQPVTAVVWVRDHEPARI